MGAIRSNPTGALGRSSAVHSFQSDHLYYAIPESTRRAVVDRSIGDRVHPSLHTSGSSTTDDSTEPRAVELTVMVGQSCHESQICA